MSANGESDVGRTFRVTRTIHLDITLDEDDVDSQMEFGDTAEESVRIIAESTDPRRWVVADEETRERDRAGDPS